MDPVVSDEVPKSETFKKKSYICTPRQLEALRKAREAKRLRKQVPLEPVPKEGGSRDEEIDVQHVINEGSKNEPVQVVRDNKMVKEFIRAERINAQETGLGKRQRDEPGDLKRLREHVDLDDYFPDAAEHGGSAKKILLGVGVGVGCGLGLAYWVSRRNQEPSSVPLRPPRAQVFAKEARSKPSLPTSTMGTVI